MDENYSAANEWTVYAYVIFQYLVVYRCRRMTGNKQSVINILSHLFWLLNSDFSFWNESFYRRIWIRDGSTIFFTPSNWLKQLFESWKQKYNLSIRNQGAMKLWTPIKNVFNEMHLGIIGVIISSVCLKIKCCTHEIPNELWMSGIIPNPIDDSVIKCAISAEE